MPLVTLDTISTHIDKMLRMLEQGFGDVAFRRSLTQLRAEINQLKVNGFVSPGQVVGSSFPTAPTPEILSSFEDGPPIRKNGLVIGEDEDDDPEEVVI